MDARPSVKDDMPDWKPILSAPLVAVVSWFVAYWVSDHRGAPEGDTNFFWLPVLPMVVGGLWVAVALAMVLARSILIGATVNASAAMTWVAAIVNVAGVGLIYGETARNVGGDGWPTDSVALAALWLAGAISLAVTAWLWRSRDATRRW